MGIFGALYIETDMTEERLLELFFQCAEVEVEMQMKDEDTSMPYASADKVDSFDACALLMTSHSYVPKQFGFTPNNIIDFTLDDHNFRQAQEDIMLATLGMISKAGLNVALIQGDSKVVLLHRAGKLTLRKDDRFWAPERLEMVKMPYTMGDLPNI